MASLIKRGKFYSLQYSKNGKYVRKSLGTDSLQIAKEHLRRFESAQARGDLDPLPTKTPIPEVLAAYVRHMKATKTHRGARADIGYLRQAFGPCCDELKPGLAPKAKGRQDPAKVEPIYAPHFESITTVQIAEFLSAVVRLRGLKPKTANRYREVITRVISWAMKEGRVRMPADRNPGSRVERYREPAPVISFLKLGEIDEQLAALEQHRQVQTMVAVYIYAGLRREEAVWLTTEDVDLHAGTNGMIRVRAKVIDGQEWQPKTGVNRAVPISSALARYLVRYRPKPTAGGWYFPSPEGARWDADNFSHRLAAMQKRAGLKWSCLEYRHTFGSHLAQKGVSLFKIATLMGNSPEICRRHYAALVPEAMGEEVEFGGITPIGSSRKAVGR